MAYNVKGYLTKTQQTKDNKNMKAIFNLSLTTGKQYTITVHISGDTDLFDIQEAIADYLNPFKQEYLHKLEYYQEYSGKTLQFTDFSIDSDNENNNALLTFLDDCNLI